MGYQVILKQYNGSSPVKTERWELDERMAGQCKNMEELPCVLWCGREEKNGAERFAIKLNYRQQFITAIV